MGVGRGAVALFPERLQTRGFAEEIVTSSFIGWDGVRVIFDCTDDRVEMVVRVVSFSCFRFDEGERREDGHGDVLMQLTECRQSPDDVKNGV